ncbi:DedA family protein [Lysinibacillus sp. 54212]|uniref:DedA family protein n=1 Tax=Lysinibacillus sp. 54212 TaxID=3119829 RepID=UPI002FC8DCB1
MSISDIFDFLKMLDTELYSYIKQFGIMIYVILFAVVFSKTAFVLLTFLPGDSLVFASGTLAAIEKLNITALFFIFFFAAILGDSQNYFIGKTINKMRLSDSWLVRFMPESAITQAKKFIEDYDRVAITFSRFVPLMRTMTPFISGYTGYSYLKFIRYNVIGALLWTAIWLVTGYALGNIKWVAENLLLTLTLITIVVFIPTLYAYFSQMVRNRKLV